MRRNMDLAREILLAIEAHPAPTVWDRIEVDGFSWDEVNYHLHLLDQAGLVAAGTQPNPNTRFGYEMMGASLTWAGHEFLDTVRDSEVWKKTKEGVAAAGGFSIDLMKALAKGFIRKQIETRTGISLDI